MFGPLEGDPGQLLKQATARKQAGDLDRAVELLREAYKQIEQGNIGYPVDTFLRLPLYLQQAGRTDEAWQEFNLLLKRAQANEISSPEVAPMECSTIYDKMRLFLQRERKPR
jgi:tetratricopeptide (TPR) repeat protein